MDGKSLLFGGALRGGRGGPPEPVEGPPDEPGLPGDEGEPGVPPELHMAAQDFLDAVKSGDAARVASAFLAMDTITDTMTGEEPDQDEGMQGGPPPPDFGGR